MANVLPTEEGMLVSGISGTMHSSSKFGLLRQPNYITQHALAPQTLGQGTKIRLRELFKI